MQICNVCGKTREANQFINKVTSAVAKICLVCRDRRTKSKNTNWRGRQEYNRRVAYGMSEGEYDRLLAVQNGKCAICSRIPGEHATYKVLAVDHDKDTKRVRGLLCLQCNVGIGMFKHDENLLRKALIYLGFRDPRDL